MSRSRSSLSEASRLERLLRDAGTPWPAPIEHLGVAASTNDELSLRARAGAVEWSVVLAERQTRGRGRQGRAWSSPAGNVHLSLLLRPSLVPEAWGVLPLAAGVAVREAVASLGVAADLKWPNDVLARGRKLAGILVEATSGGDGLDSAVVGIGVNVAAAPAELGDEATALSAEGAAPCDVVETAAAVLARLSVCYHALARDGPPAILARWREGAARWLGSPVEVHGDGSRIRGVALDVDERGALLVAEASGRVLSILAGEVRSVRRSPS
jgi:BirA family biotin operon repressor/biotin-[acetyl-CoA-carboxylase] ligase